MKYLLLSSLSSIQPMMHEKLKGKTLTREEANKKLEALHEQFKKDLSQLKIKT
jgi:hypothetical protein